MLEQQTIPPVSLGYRMPAEWSHHAATWLAWPHEASDWPGRFEVIPFVYADIVRHLAPSERVNILVQTPDTEETVRKLLRSVHADLAAVAFFYSATDRSWIRDCGPMFIRTGQDKVGILDWSFNGWSKYDNFSHDDAVTSSLASRLNLPVWRPEHEGKRIVLEGGSIEVNGSGALITTEECLLSSVQARNPGLSRAEYEQIFLRYLGVEHTIWLRNGIAGDDTHGHIDDIARFTDPETVVVAIEQHKSEANHDPLAENLALLKEAADQHGRSLKLHTLQLPEPVYFENQRLPASYANFYIANKVVLVPVFGDPQDRYALETLSSLFPEREVVPIHSRDLVLGLGALHCMTQQQPA